MKRYYWAGISNDERINAIDKITGIIGKYATVLNFQRYSDISLSLILEIEECKVNDLYNSLKSIITIDCNPFDLSDSQICCIILLSITFTQGTGDMKIEVPQIPG
jgi:hypothetical protein